MEFGVSGILGAQQGRFGRVTLFDIRDPVADHAHPHVHLLYKVAGSDRGLDVGGEPVLLGDRTCVLVNPWQRHADLPDRCIAPTVMLALYIDAAYVEQHFGAPSAAVFATSCGPVSPAARDLVGSIADLVAGDRDSARLESAILDLLADALNHAGSGGEVRSGVSDYRIRRAMAQLGQHPHLHPDLRRVASSVGLSRSRFFEQFKNAVGIAPTMYVDGLLLEEAIVMLASSGRSLKDISDSLGFAAQSSFSRFFKDRVGFSPNVLRHAVLSN
jgi:AraC family transcriptional regulator